MVILCRFMAIFGKALVKRGFTLFLQNFMNLKIRVIYVANGRNFKNWHGANAQNMGRSRNCNLSRPSIFLPNNCGISAKYFNLNDK